MKEIGIWLVLQSVSLVIALDTLNCGGSFDIPNAGDTGVIKSPNYPQNYGILDKCIWKFIARVNYSVELQIPSFSGQDGFNGTCRDYLEIRDGSFKEILLAKICNTSATTVVQSRSRWLWVKFYSDYETVNTGFKATWKLIYHGYNSQRDPSLFTGCRTPKIFCPNAECVPTSYRCDGVNDCGYVGTGSDEDYWCDYKFIGKNMIYAWGFGSGAITCLLVFMLALCLEGYCGCCCPNGMSEKLACYKCMKRLSGKGAHQERKNWPTYMRNPAILKLTGDAEGFKEYEKFDKERDQKKYEKIKKLKLEDAERVRKLSTISLQPGRKGSATPSKDAKKPAKKGEVNVSFENEGKNDSKSVNKKLTRQKAFNYEEQPQLEDEVFRDGLTPLPSPNLSERDSGSSPEPPATGAKKTLTKKASRNGDKGSKVNDSKATPKGRVKEVAKKK